jgi:hypothetical protein
VGILKEEGLDLDSGSSGDGEPAAAVSTDEEVSPLSTLADSSGNAAASSSLQQQEQPAAGSSSSSGVGRETVEVQEAGLTFLATPEAGQKTGMRQGSLMLS